MSVAGKKIGGQGERSEEAGNRNQELGSRDRKILRIGRSPKVKL